MADISSSHDSFFRSVLSDSRIAKDYFRSALPEHIIKLPDFTTLERVPDSYVSGELEKTMSDVVYTCRRNDRKGNVSVCLLVEHKSAPDKYTPVQVGGYLFSGDQLQILGKRNHGKQRWEYWTLDRLFDGLGEELLGFIPTFEYVYHNLRDTPETAIRMIGNQFLVSALLTLKYAFDKRRLKEHFQDILEVGLAEGDDNQQIALLIYSLSRVDYTEEQIREIADALPFTIKDKVMRSTYDLLIEKGIEQRIERGIEQGKATVVANLIQQLGLDDKAVAGIAEVPIDFVHKVRAELHKKKK